MDKSALAGARATEETPIESRRPLICKRGIVCMAHQQTVGSCRPAMVGCEVKEESTSDSDASSATDANEYMAAADMQVMRCQQDRFNFTQSLINLVRSPLP